MSVARDASIDACNSPGANDAEDVAEEAHSTTIPLSLPPKRNAFSELMSPSKRRAVPLPDTSMNTNALPSNRDFTFQGRDGLGAYITSPESFPASRVLYYNDNFVVINDLFPKSSVHVLVIPRHPLTKVHPLRAFEQDPELLQATVREVNQAKKLVASELRRKFGKFSQKDQARTKVMQEAVESPDGSLPSLDGLPRGRDWEAEVLTGVHSGPSMNHLHVHVLSRDRFSDCLKHRKHYNSFATAFMVGLEEFPLAADDVRRRPDHGGFLKDDMHCWRCGKNFRNRFQELRQHLVEEFENWKRD